MGPPLFFGPFASKGAGRWQGYLEPDEQGARNTRLRLVTQLVRDSRLLPLPLCDLGHLLRDDLADQLVVVFDLGIDQFDMPYFHL